MTTVDINECSYTGILFQRVKWQTWEEVMPSLWGMVEENNRGLYFPCTISMPCNSVVTYKTLNEIPKQDTACPCGNPKHWLIRWREIG